jgi:hypothetical protein
MTRQQWVFFQPCDCPFHVTEARRADRAVALTTTDAWREAYDNDALAAGRARAAGVRAELFDQDRYLREVAPVMRDPQRCTHLPGTPPRTMLSLATFGRSATPPPSDHPASLAKAFDPSGPTPYAAPAASPARSGPAHNAAAAPRTPHR